MDQFFNSSSTGDAFREAAKRLTSAEGESAFGNLHLPINYLYRHSIELFLKSMIVTMHRALKLPTADGPHTHDPKIRIGNKWKPLTRIHSVRLLLDEFERLVAVNRAAMDRLSAGTWKTPNELRISIEIIEAHDSGSTFSRYPQSNSCGDAKKSSYRKVEIDELVEEMNAKKDGQRGKVVLAIKDDNEEIVEAFVREDSVMPDFRAALVNASDLLNGGACGIHMELVEHVGLKMKKWRSEKLHSKRKATKRKPK